MKVSENHSPLTVSDARSSLDSTGFLISFVQHWPNTVNVSIYNMADF